MFNLGTPELIIILGIALLIFGGKKLPDLARGLGSGIRNFKEALTAPAEVKGREEPRAIPDAPSTCPHCQQALSGRPQFCSHCGKPVGEGSPQAS